MISQEYIRKYAERIRLCRSRMLAVYPFFGILMMNVRFALDDTIGTAATDGERIIFDPAFELSDEELDFVVMHELMHLALDHLGRGKSFNRLIFNVACDIVINSTIMNMMGVKSFVVAGEEAMHTLPDGSEGHLYSSEEVYSKLISFVRDKDPDKESLPWLTDGEGLDSHSLWDKITEQRRQQLSQLVNDAAAAVSRMAGNVPGNVERALKQRRSPKLDWRRILSEFVQEDMFDYSFVRPDRRYSGDFILPGFVELEECVKNILFMIDTSGSMEDDDITAVFSEVCGAVEQFGGRLSGLLGFFDCAVTEPVPFESISDLLRAKPVGGGGTSVKIIFDYVRDHMKENPPASIIVLTDGWVDFPEKPCSDGIPVLWVFTNDFADFPSWGKTVCLESFFESDDDDEELPF